MFSFLCLLVSLLFVFVVFSICLCVVFVFVVVFVFLFFWEVFCFVFCLFHLVLLDAYRIMDKIYFIEFEGNALFNDALNSGSIFVSKCVHL